MYIKAPQCGVSKLEGQNINAPMKDSCWISVRAIQSNILASNCWPVLVALQPQQIEFICSAPLNLEFLFSYYSSAFTK